MSFMKSRLYIIFFILIINFALSAIDEVHSSEFEFSILQIKAPRCPKLKRLLCCCSSSSRAQEYDLESENETETVDDESSVPVLLAYNPAYSGDGSCFEDGNNMKEEDDSKCCSCSSSSRRKRHVSESHSVDFNPDASKFLGFTSTKTTNPPSDPDPPQLILDADSSTSTTTKITVTTSNDN
ncbi:putative integral membrane protein [Cryptosporidium meleagridis]|uniref:Putative integral membrane protein n=1 Tax=Cryptosporidium meleagridis TaxID=93969 RepID=A0A2P4Z1B9_9CRYT|nr:putative integral membrane protein [Cryptosporidium meleagridis]